MHPPIVNLVAQRLKDLSENNDDDEGLVQVALQNRKVVASNVPTPKKVKKAQPIAEPRASILPSAIPRWIKAKETMANPKIGDNEWVVSFTRNKKDLAFSSSNNESTNDTSIMLLCKSAPNTQLRPPFSPLHLERFKMEAPSEPLLDAQSFPLAFIHDNPTRVTPFYEAIFSKLVVRDIVFVLAPSWMQYDYLHSSFEAFKALPLDAIFHLPPPTWTHPVQLFVIKMPPHWLAPKTQ